MKEQEMLAEAPDIETSSADYASRFAGKTGAYLLGVQGDAVANVLKGIAPGSVLDVGGGHGQLVGLLKGLGWNVTVHGSARECADNLRDLHGQRDVAFLQGRLLALPATDQSFDLVIAVRLISHVADWRRLLAEMCRVARHTVVIDFPSSSGLNALTPWLFGLKKSIEGNTRTYTSFSHSELCDEFARHGFAFRRQERQFFLPMAIHRAGHSATPLRWAESTFRGLGLTALAGSPVILRADRTG